MDRLLSDLSHPDHAYAFGCIAAGGHVDGEHLEVRLPGRGGAFVRLLRESRGAESEARVSREGRATRVRLPLSPLLRGSFGKGQGARVSAPFPALDRKLSLAFCRGVFDVAGTIRHPDAVELAVRLERQPEALEKCVLEWLGTPPSEVDAAALTWFGAAALDVLGFLYDGLSSEAANGHHARDFALARKKNLKRYAAWCRKVQYFAHTLERPQRVYVQRVHPDAIMPGKGRVSDSGYDLTVVHKVKSFGPTILYGTGISLEPPQGWYFDVVARSSIIKLGYMISNSVGIIDRAYRGEIMVPLVKIDPDAPELVLPARIAQLIPRPIVHFPFVETKELGATHRGAGGFGSTG